MQAGDYGEERSEPWTYRARVVPLKTWSGRVVHHRRKHFFKIGDVSRILAKIQPPDTGEDIPTWLRSVIQTLRAATIGMLDRLLWFMDERSVESLYEFGIDILDRMFRIEQPPSTTQLNARRLIIQIADRAGLTVTIKKE